MELFDLMKANAKHFDTLYIQPQDKVILCDSENMILDYLIMKCNLTPNVVTMIVAPADSFTPFVGALEDRIEYIPDGYNNFDYTNTSTTGFRTLKFLHGSIIRVMDDQSLDNGLRGMSPHIVYIRNGTDIKDHTHLNVAMLIKSSRLVYNMSDWW